MSLTWHGSRRPIAGHSKDGAPPREVREPCKSGKRHGLASEHAAAGGRPAAPSAATTSEKLGSTLANLRAAVVSRRLFDERHGRLPEATKERLRPVVAAIADQRSDRAPDQIRIGLERGILAHRDLRR